MIKFKPKPEPPQIDDSKLIKYVSNHKFLYETKHPDYRNLPLRLSVWNEIASKLNIDDQNVVQKRWKVLREKFAVAYRKELLQEIECPWPLYNNLRFLEEFVMIKEPKPQLIHGTSKTPIAASPLDELAIIDLVKQYPMLYDKRHEDFRSATSRHNAWEEISAKCKWDVATIQKRWRVLRDRFVRELRRTQDGTGDHSCSAFFREMLFLTNHVRSKKYEVEADFASDSKTTIITDSGDESEKEQMWMMEETTDEYQENANELDEDNSSYQYINDEGDEVTEAEVLEEEEVMQSEYIEEESDDVVEELKSIDTSIVTEEVDNQVWLKDENSKTECVLDIASTSRKRRASSSEDFQEQPKPKIKSESKLISRTSPDMHEEMDEDMAFARTIGCMLKKIPANLKTAVKLKLLSSLAEFEAQYKLV